MLEILALVYLSRKMANLAERKGLNRSTWRLYTVLAWIGAELLGIVLSFLITDEIGVTLLFAYGFAIGSYFLLKSSLSKRPGIADASFEFEQQAQQ